MLPNPIDVCSAMKLPGVGLVKVSAFSDTEIRQNNEILCRNLAQCSLCDESYRSLCK